MTMIPKIIKKYIPLVIFTKRAFEKVKADDVFIPDKETENHVFIFLAADYGNLGDIAITLAQKRLLQKSFPRCRITEVPASWHLDKIKGICKQVNKTDVVTIVGGGNMGDMYGGYEMVRQLLTRLFAKNRVLSFPQTVDFSNTAKGKEYLKSAIFSYRGKNLVLMAREHKSFLFMQKHFKAQSVEVPDVVMTLKYWDAQFDRHGISLCFRADKEKVLSDSIIAYMREFCKHQDVVSEIDTHVGDNFDVANKYDCLNSFLDKLSKTRLLITDRLHGMIFAYITGTPAIVFDNSNKKVQQCFRWIENCGFIHYVDEFDRDSFAHSMNELLNCKIDIGILEQNRKKFLNFFEGIL